MVRPLREFEPDHVKRVVEDAMRSAESYLRGQDKALRQFTLRKILALLLVGEGLCLGPRELERFTKRELRGLMGPLKLPRAPRPSYLSVQRRQLLPKYHAIKPFMDVVDDALARDEAKTYSYRRVDATGRPFPSPKEFYWAMVRRLGSEGEVGRYLDDVLAGQGWQRKVLGEGKNTIGTGTSVNGVTRPPAPTAQPKQKYHTEFKLPTGGLVEKGESPKLNRGEPWFRRDGRPYTVVSSTVDSGGVQHVTVRP